MIPDASFALRTSEQIDSIPRTATSTWNAAPTERVLMDDLIEREVESRVGGHVDLLRQSGAVVPF